MRKPGKIIASLALCLTVGLLSACAANANSQPFEQWLEGVKQEARQKGISEQTIESALGNIRLKEKVVSLDRKQPESRITFSQYVERVLSTQRIEKGERMYQQHKPLLDEVAAKFGVQPRFIVALWGVETSYGAITGGHSIPEALATLAYDGRRADFFRDELMKALKIIDEGHISAENMKGSWAGAMGQSQFMPSSFLAYAYDYDGDGHKDIWGTLPDVFASIANYLSKSGWNDDLTWGREVRVPSGFDKSLEGRKVKKPIAFWQAQGVRRMDGGDLPSRNIDASIVITDDGRAFMTYANYDVLMKWNRSIYFASTVGMLSDRIAYPWK